MEFRELHFLYSKKIRNEYMQGNLWNQWMSEFPQIFKIEENAWAPNQYNGGYGFFEMLTAILIYKAVGFLSLTEYCKPNKHPQDITLMKKMLDDDLYKFSLGDLTYIGHKPQPPDLFCFAPDYSDWFFCEVKGNQDRFRNYQLEYFRDMQKRTGGKVYLCKLKPI